MDLKLTDYDMDITDGELAFVNGRIAIGQNIVMNLRTWLGETVYDLNVGVPYLQVIFQRGVDPGAIQFILEQQVLNVAGVTAVELEQELDTDTRELSVTGKAETIDGEIDFSLIVEAP